MNSVEKSYEIAKERYAAIGVDTEQVLKVLKGIPLSLHCWQADDVAGFETSSAILDGSGLQISGNHPGKARNVADVRQDLEKVMSIIPGKQRVNLHAIYGEFGGQKVERDQIELKHFQGWIDWAKKLEMGLDMNPTCFAHPFAADGFTLSSKNEEHRKFWVEHVKRTRKIAAEMGKQLGTPTINNVWIPDGTKDEPVDRNGYRVILKKSLDEIFADEYPKNYVKDAVESKLFGIGSESMVVGSHDFYLGYAIKNNKLICLDNGHFHPTEQIGDKISSCLQFVDELLLHVTRGIRWDSDHVTILNNEVQLIAQEIVRCNALDRVHIGLDYFDGSINRIGAYVIGARAMRMALLCALLEPTDTIKSYEEAGKNFERLAMLEMMKFMPFSAVWDYFCQQENVPNGKELIDEITKYENEVLLKR